MPISFGGRPKEDDVLALIAAKSYGRAIERLKARLRSGGSNPTLRMQLADVLILAEKKAEALTLLLRLADEYATEGFAAKAISVLKKAQKIDPGRRDVETRLALLIQQKQREAAAAAGVPGPSGQSPDDTVVETGGGTLEIGLDIGAVSVPVPAPRPPALLALDPDATLPYDESLRPSSAPAGVAPPALAAAAPAESGTEGLPLLDAEVTAEPLAAEPPGAAEAELPALEAELVPVEPEPPVLVPLDPTGAEDKASDASVEPDVDDYDLLYTAVDSDEPVTTIDDSALGPMSSGEFTRELMSLVDTVFRESPAAAADGDRPGRCIVVSPLFRDFSVDEMVAVIEGLKLITVERGDVILREGQPGASLFMITAGRVRAFRRDVRGRRQVPLGDLQEGAFFGEMSVLTGRPRMASVVALTRTELLELDRATLAEITKTHPRVWDVLREFAQNRAMANLSEAPDATHRS